ncbi:hypothetical protein ACQPZQ_13565 [Pseudonocardia sp. CA-142604]|uniref:hypothetical protein n=1 Tax=Pseudonocardia sp. CA-142604 TaxID=3240024 RepID=UPI003D90D1E0
MEVAVQQAALPRRHDGGGVAVTDEDEALLAEPGCRVGGTAKRSGDSGGPRQQIVLGEHERRFACQIAADRACGADGRCQLVAQGVRDRSLGQQARPSPAQQRGGGGPEPARVGRAGVCPRRAARAHGFSRGRFRAQPTPAPPGSAGEPRPRRVWRPAR